MVDPEWRFTDCLRLTFLTFGLKEKGSAKSPRNDVRGEEFTEAGEEETGGE